MCSLVCLKQLPTLPTPSQHLQEKPTAGFLPVLELLAVPCQIQHKELPTTTPGPLDQLGKEAAPQLPDSAHPKTKSPFLVLKMRFSFLKPSPQAGSGSNSENPDDLLFQIHFQGCHKDWQLPESCPTQGPEAGTTSATRAMSPLHK